MQIHDFNDSLKIEQSGFERQDRFYMEYFENLPHRVTFKENPEFQKSDRDLEIYNKAGELKTVSEKNRTRQYNDVLFEIYSNYSTKIGWGLDSTADLLAYFLPECMFLVDMPSMVRILQRNKLKEQVSYQEEYFKLGTIDIDGNEYKVPLIRANNKGYFSLSIAFTTEQLKRMGVRHKVF